MMKFNVLYPGAYTELGDDVSNALKSLGPSH
jgi:hypothetical protein